VLGINQDAVTIKQVEVEIIDNAFDKGWVVPLPPDRLTNKKVAVVGSGPAGLAAAQQLTRAGHQVTVFERADRIGGLLRYGIPEFKMEKRHIDRRIEQMEAEGTQFRTGVNVGVDLTAAQLRLNYDAVVLTGGATAWRDLPIPGRELDGIHQAMEYLPWANRVQNGDPVLGADGEPPITA
jgi:glutamate synthase (NADPH/NADH) small chain